MTDDIDINVLDLIPIIRKINRYIINDELAILNRRLSNLDVKQENPAIIMTWLRASNVIRTQLPAWEKLLNKAKNEYINRGLDEILIGLI